MKAYTLALTVAILLFVPGSSKAQDTALKVVTPVVITIDDSTGEGQAAVNLRNDSPKNDSQPQPDKHVILSVSVTGPKGSSAKFSFSENKDQKQGSPQYDTKLTPGGEKTVWLNASDVWDLGEFEADLNNETTLLTKIRLKRAPFNIKFDGATPETANVALVDGQPYALRLKNEDARPYPVAWKLLFNGADVCRGNVTLPPAGVGLLNCSPTVGFDRSHLKDIFKPDSTDGNLLQLFPNPRGQDVGNGLPVKTLSVTGSMSYFDPFTQQVWGYITIVAVLILGGLTSLFLSQALPNRLQRLKIAEQIDELAKATADLSSHVESRLQVLLRLERSRIGDVLDSRKSWSPDFQGVVTLCTQDLARLKVRVGLAQQLDVVQRRLADMLPHGVPPQQVDAVQEQVRRAVLLIGKTAPTDDDLKAAQSAITKATDLVNGLNKPDPTFGADLAQRAVKLKDQIDTKFRTANETFKRIIQEVPDPDNTLKEIASTTTDIPADSYVAVDIAVAKMSLIRDYVVLHDTRTGDAKTRLEAAEKRFIGLLQTDNPHDLCDARVLFREMKEDVYGERIGQLLNNQNATIKIDPQVAYHAAPMELCVEFQNSSLNLAAARDEWSCTWDFGDNLKENGWAVSHYFLLPKPTGRKFFNRLLRRPYSHTFPIVATFEQRTERTATSAAGQFVLNKDLEVRSSAENAALRGRAWTEGLKLAAALLIAVFGLVAGAREQLTKLDILPGLVAVFLVGFGADTIKNLLTPKP
jgi:hypothetical protein